MIERAIARDEALLNLLRRHPRIASVEVGGDVPLTFEQGPWVRKVLVGDPYTALQGLLELMDNNPVVCADALSVPGPAETLALIALGPLAVAGAIRETPTMVCSVPAEMDRIEAFLGGVGWTGSIVLSVEEHDLAGVAAATVMVEIETPAELDEIDELYDERFGRSFFVRRDEASEWGPSLVQGEPFACYRLRITPDDPVSLLTIHVLADLQGKCGATQIVHAMNVMAGFEESLGIA